MRALVSGTSSGLGKFFKHALHADGYSRSSGLLPSKEPYDIIVHCAFNTANDLAESDPQYIHDTIGLTEKLLSVPHKQFVFISSVDVYPNNIQLCKEDSVFESNAISTNYGRMKYKCELLVRSKQPNYLIVRPTALLGPTMKPNSLLKILSGEKSLRLSGDSSFNYILYEDVLQFVSLIVSEKQSGVFNLAASNNITLAEVCKAFKKEVHFENKFTYVTGNIDNTKASKLLPIFNEPSMANIRRFWKNYSTASAVVE